MRGVAEEETPPIVCGVSSLQSWISDKNANSEGGLPVHLQEVDHWERKAEQARDVAAKMSGQAAKSVMMDLAAHYEKLASRARTIEAMLVPTGNPN